MVTSPDTGPIGPIWAGRFPSRIKMDTRVNSQAVEIDGNLIPPTGALASDSRDFWVARALFVYR